jgi:hypothetical protein
MNTVTVTLGELVDRTLEGLQNPAEIGRTVVLDGAIGPGDSGLQLVDATVINPTDVLEFADELIYVTAKANDTPSSSVSILRGHAGTTAQEHADGAVAITNPGWLSRRRVQNKIRESFTYLEGNGLPLVLIDDFVMPFTDPIDNVSQILPMPDGARRILGFKSGTWAISNWGEIADVPTSMYPSSRVVRLPRHLYRYTGPYSIVYQMPYRFSDDPPVESSTIDLPEGAEFLPQMYAAWKLVEAREVSRNQIDRSEEFQSGQRDTGPTLVRLLRESFFSGLDAAKRNNKPPVHRPYVSNPTFTGLTGYRLPA